MPFFIHVTCNPSKTVDNSENCISLQVVGMLKGDPKCLEMLKEQEKCPHRRTLSDEIFHTEEYNSTMCLNDQNSQNDKVS